MHILTTIILALLLGCQQPKRAPEKTNMAPKAISAKGAYLTAPNPAPRVTVTNAIDGGRIQSGFLIGTAADDDGIERVEVRINDAGFALADGTTAWAFKLPTGLRPGTLLKVAVRSVDTEGAFSPETTLIVRKGANQDINGDGHADLVVGAPGFDLGSKSDAGRVHVFFGTPTGLNPAAVSSADAETTLIGEDSRGRLGTSQLLADVDGDGYADLVAAAPEALGGRIFIIQGKPAGMASGYVREVADHILQTSDSGSGFGRLVAAGDINGDGFDDLVAASTGADVLVFFGSEDGLGDETMIALTGTDAATALLVADLDRDGIDDIALGEANAPSGGQVRLYRGTVGGPSREADAVIRGSAGGLGFGAALAAGFVDSDLFMDLVVARFSETAAASEIHVIYGGVSGLDAFGSKTSKLVAADGANLTMAAADLDGRGRDELIVTAATRGKPGVIYLVDGAELPAVGVLRTLAAARLTEGKTTKALGVSAPADFNHDGLRDLIVAVPYARDIGQISLILSQLGALPSAATLDGAAIQAISGENTGDFFGLRP